MSKILIIVDPADKKQTALSRGLELAQALSADVEAVCFTHEYLKTATEKAATQTKLKDQLINQRKNWLEKELGQYRYEGIKVSQKVVWSKQLHQWIINRCEQQAFEAVVKTGHRSDTFYHTSTDWHLLRECPAPVLLVAEKKWRKSRPILAAVDLSSRKQSKQQLNRKIILTAAAYARRLGTELHLVHCIYVSKVLEDLDLIDSNSLTRQRKAELKPAIEKLCAEFGLKKHQVHIRSGIAHKVIPSVADKIKADLVVMGTVSSRGLAARLIGHTAEKVLTHLRTDVLALKPDA